MKKTTKTQEMAYIAIMAVVIAACAWISIPTKPPFTMQTFGVFTALVLLGGKKGTLSTVVYILLGAVGLPVFSNGTGGLGVLFGSTGGYIVGFVVMGLIYMLVTYFTKEKVWGMVLAMLLGQSACYLFGTLWFVQVYSAQNSSIGIGTALMMCVVPYIIPDIVKLVMAVAIGRGIGKIIFKQ